MKIPLLFLFFFALSGLYAQSGVLWYADPNKRVTDNFRRLDDDGNRSGTYCVDNPNNPVTAESRIDATYGRYWRITKPEGRKRAEFARMGSINSPVVPREGQTIYLGWRYRVLSYPDLNQGIAVFQWKSAGSPNTQNYPLNFYYDGSTLSLNAYGPKQRDGGSINQWRTRLWSRTLNENQWITIVLGIKVSSDPRQGYVELWINGSKQTLSNSQVDQYRAVISGDGKRAYHRTFDGSEVYPKWGSYNQASCSFRVLSDFQDLRAGTSYTAARPRPASGSGRATVGAADQDTLLWYGDPNASVADNFRRLDDDGNRSGTFCVDDDVNNPVVVTNPVDALYGKYWRLVKPVGRKRAELARTTGAVNNYTPREGDSIFLGWRYRVSSTPDLDKGIAVFQWKSIGAENTQNYPFNIGYNGTELTLDAYGPFFPTWNTATGSITKRRTRLWTQALEAGEWVTIVIGLKLSRSADDGFIELWYNGVKQRLANSLVREYEARISDDSTRAYHKTFDAAEVYPKWGSYNQNACDFAVTTDLADMRVGTTYPAAAPGSSAEDPTGVDDFSHGSFDLYPNPTTDRLYLRGLPTGAALVRVYDVAGRKLLTFRSPGTDTSLDLDTHPLDPGTYLLTVQVGSGLFRRRFVKQ